MRTRLTVQSWVVLLAWCVNASIAAAENPVVVIETNLGDITVELYETRAKETVANFLQYAEDGFYEGTLFHRIQRNVIIQGGGFTPGFQLKKTRAPIRNEARASFKNDRGTIAMARGSNPHSATSQFFINLKNNPAFNQKGRTRDEFGYAVFGRVIDGSAVVTTIGSVSTKERGGMADVPSALVIIKRVRLAEQ